MRSVELGARSVVGSCRWVVGWCRSVAVVVVWWLVECGELGGFCRCGGTSIFAFVYIFRSVSGVLSTWQHRAVGGSSDGGVKGIPLNNPRFG